MSTARSETSTDDNRLRITTWTFGDGEDTGHHRHEYDYAVVPITGGTFEITEPDGTTREMTQHAARSYLGRAGTEHNVINRSGRIAVFVELEFKQ
jgi:beta-alanine degradation protein BauB